MRKPETNPLSDLAFAIDSLSKTPSGREALFNIQAIMEKNREPEQRLLLAKLVCGWLSHPSIANQFTQGIAQDQMMPAEHLLKMEKFRAYARRELKKKL